MTGSYESRRARGYRVCSSQSSAITQITLISISVFRNVGLFTSVLYGIILFFNHLTYFAPPKIVYFIKDRLSFLCFYVIFKFLLLVLRKYLEPNKFWKMFAVPDLVVLPKRTQHRQNLCTFTNNLLTQELSLFNITNMATMRNFDILTGKFNLPGTCANDNYV